MVNVFVLIGTQMSELPKKRGRPRAFDEHVVLDRAIETFLRHGYAGASLDALTSSMGVNKPSLYAAFGEKRGLFLRATEALARRVAQRLGAAFERGASLEDALAAMFLEAVEVYSGGQAPPGCLIVSGTITESIVDPGMAEFSRAFLARCDVILGKGIAAKRLEGTEETAMPSAVLSRLANGVVHDIALRARAGESKASLRKHARGAASALARAAQ